MIPQRWRLLSGENNWQNLLSPLDNDLKQYINHYGAMAQATYDTFNMERNSKYTGCSRYSRRNLFSRVGLVNGNPFKYEAVKYIYATSSISVPESFLLKSMSHDAWLEESNWIGYVAVATDEGKIALGRRDILVVWRGTIQPIEWVKDFDFPLVPASKIIGTDGENAYVHKGFLSVYTSDNERSKFNKTSARDQVLSEVKKQVEQFKDEDISITITGHSMGGALSAMSAGDIVANGFNKPSDQPNKPCTVTAFIFASPRVGDSNYFVFLQSMNDLRILNIKNAPDIVPTLPPFPYIDVGVNLLIDSRKSPYLKHPGDFFSWHSLEGAYLRAVTEATRNEGGTDQELEVKRDLALVNKSSYALKDEFLVPVFWWMEKNRGMVQKSNGSWVLHDHETDDDDP
ncbi:hypothetical protein ACJIZ3_006910 [Penstemon smallii]|uniref:Phospholipase A1 n=1 Tax=Penstemon smallii TaxID=265156 RepID=A0ABD3S9B9_9LAMI